MRPRFKHIIEEIIVYLSYQVRIFIFLNRSPYRNQLLFHQAQIVLGLQKLIDNKSDKIWTGIWVIELAEQVFHLDAQLTLP